MHTPMNQISSLTVFLVRNLRAGPFFSFCRRPPGASPAGDKAGRNPTVKITVIRPAKTHLVKTHTPSISSSKAVNYFGCRLARGG